MISALAHAGVLVGSHRVVDLRSVIRSVTPRAYWRADDIQVTGALGTTSRLTRYAGGDFFGGGNIIPSGALTRFIPIRCVVSTGGGYGAGKVDISYDGGVSFAMTNATIQSSVALTGAGAGTSLSFNNTTFTLSDVFENGHEHWNDRGQNNYDLDRAVATYYLAPRLRYADQWASLGAGSLLASHLGILVTEATGAGPSDTGHTIPPASVVMPAPGTTPTYITGIIKQVAIIGGSVERSFCIGSSTSKFRVFITGAGAVTVHNGTSRVWPSYTFAKFGKWIRFRAYFSNSSSDFLTLGADSTTFASAGNNSDTAFQPLMRDSTSEATSGSAGQQGIAEMSIWNGLPSAYERTREDSYYTARYGSGPTTA